MRPRPVGPDVLDRLRDLVEGRLDEEAEDRLLEEIERRPELARLLDDLVVVHAVTDGVPASAVRDLPRRRATRSWIAAAAAVAAVAALSFAAGRHAARGPRVVRLTAIPLSAPVVVDAASHEVVDEAATATLASWQPVEQGRIRWLASMEEGEAIARATGRPILLFVYHPSCPWCIQLREASFVDNRVVELADEFVPVHVDVETAGQELVDSLTGWPYLAAVRPDGTRVREFPGLREAPELSEELRAALAKFDLAVSVPWDRAQALARELEAARAAERAGRYGVSFAMLERVHDEDASGAFGSAADVALGSLLARARESLLRARVEAEAGRLPEAEAVLARAAEGFGGSAPGDDLSRVRDELVRTGRFPLVDSAIR